MLFIECWGCPLTSSEHSLDLPELTNFSISLISTAEFQKLTNKINFVDQISVLLLNCRPSSLLNIRKVMLTYLGGHKCDTSRFLTALILQILSRVTEIAYNIDSSTKGLKIMPRPQILYTGPKRCYEKTCSPENFCPRHIQDVSFEIFSPLL